MTGTPTANPSPLRERASGTTALAGARASSSGGSDVENRRRLDDVPLFARLRSGDAGARDALAARYLPLARSLARRYSRSGEPMDDLVQVASLGLVKAIGGFDPGQGTAFSSYAVPTIVGELKRHFRDRTWTVRPPRALQELTLRVEHAITRLSHVLDRAPTVGELAAELGSSQEEILEALQARDGRSGVSLDAPHNGDEDHPALQDTLGSLDDGFSTAESRATLDSMMAGLSPRSHEVLRLRFEEDMTQAQIGERVGVSQMQVSRLIRQALKHMRDAVQ
jgi:RNA polymerase sigma-B factor